jgi:hypothetical protein
VGWSRIFCELILRWMSANAISVQTKVKILTLPKNGEGWGTRLQRPGFF